MAVVHEEALRAMAQQQANLDSLRARAGTLLSAASISTAFLGGQALADHEPGGWEWLAIVFLVVLFAAAITLLWPYTWVFRRSAKEMLRDYVEHERPLELAAMQRDLALHLESNFEKNEAKLNKLLTVFQVGAVMLALEVVAWLLELRGRR